MRDGEIKEDEFFGKQEVYHEPLSVTLAVTRPGGADTAAAFALPLVVGLQGRFEEANEIASQGLPAEQVRENMAYLKKMLSQPNNWQQVGDGDSKG